MFIPPNLPYYFFTNIDFTLIVPIIRDGGSIYYNQFVDMIRFEKIEGYFITIMIYHYEQESVPLHTIKATYTVEKS